MSWITVNTLMSSTDRFWNTYKLSDSAEPLGQCSKKGRGRSKFPGEIFFVSRPGCEILYNRSNRQAGFYAISVLEIEKASY
jgi:hypothetical protein